MNTSSKDLHLKIGLLEPGRSEILTHILAEIPHTLIQLGPIPYSDVKEMLLNESIDTVDVIPFKDRSL